jgi:hypothetical protein
MTPTSGVGNAFSAMNGVGVGNDGSAKVNIDTTSNNHIAWAFRRAPRFFDVVCYTGTGSANRTVTHNLGVTPGFIIVKRRNTSRVWYCWHEGYTGAGLYLNQNGMFPSDTPGFSTTQNDSNIALGSSSATTTDESGGTYIAYLFATLNGVSKVGSYTGTGTTLAIDCGFSAGARFVLIKRTDSTGDWYVWDSARGIVSGNDPYILTNSTAAEVTSTDYIDPFAAGFEISSTAPAAINASGGSFIFLAIA